MVLSCQQKNRCSLPLWRCFHHSLEHIFKWKQPHQQQHVWGTWSPVTRVPSTSKSNFVVLMLWMPRSLSGITSATESRFTQYSVPPGAVHTQGLIMEKGQVIVSQHLTVLLSHSDPELTLGTDLWPVQLNFSLWLILFLPFLFHRGWSKKYFLINIQNTKLYNTHLYPDCRITLPHGGNTVMFAKTNPFTQNKRKKRIPYI